MAVYWSAAAAGFYDASHPAIPADAVRITPARHRALLAGQDGGAAIVAGDDGHPRLVRPAPATIADQRARAARRVKREAARRIEAVAPLWRQMNDMRDPEAPGAAERFAAIDAIRAASAAIEAQIAIAPPAALDALDIPAHPAWPAETRA